MPPRPAPALLWVAGLLLAGLLLYSASFSSTVQPGRGGELIAAACGLHQLEDGPEVPLLLLLGRGVCLLPWSTPAGRLALLSGLCGVWAVLLLFATVRRCCGSSWAAGMAALTLATGEIFWRASSQASLFTLNAALVISALYCAVRLAPGPAGARGGAGGPVVGAAGWSLGAWLALALGLGVHPSSLLAAPLVLAATLGPARPLGRLAARAAGAFAGLGLGLGGLVAGGATAAGLLDPARFSPWLAGGSTGASALAGVPPGVARAGWLLEALPTQLGGVLWPLALLGLAVAAHRAAGRPLGRCLEPWLRRDLAGMLALLPLVCGPVYMLLWGPTEGDPALGQARPHFILPSLSLCVLLGFGLALLERSLLAGEGRRGARRLWHLVGLGVLILFALMTRHRTRVGGDFLVEDFAKNSLGAVERGGALLTSGSTRCAALRYARAALRLRPDVQVVCLDRLRSPRYLAARRRERPGFSFRPEAGQGVDVLRLIQGEMRRGVPVSLATSSHRRVRNAFGSYPAGPVMRLLPPHRSPPTARQLERMNRRLFRGFSRRGELPHRPDPLRATELLEPYARAWLEIGQRLQAGGENKAALRALVRANAWAPWLPVPGWFQRGKRIQLLKKGPLRQKK